LDDHAIWVIFPKIFTTGWHLHPSLISKTMTTGWRCHPGHIWKKSDNQVVTPSGSHFEKSWQLDEHAIRVTFSKKLTTKWACHSSVIFFEMWLGWHVHLVVNFVWKCDPDGGVIQLLIPNEIENQMALIRLSLWQIEKSLCLSSIASQTPNQLL